MKPDQTTPPKPNPEPDPVPLKWTISTTVDPESETIGLVTEGPGGYIVREVMGFKEKSVRDALIKLGWTPPNETSPSTGATE